MSTVKCETVNYIIYIYISDIYLLYWIRQNDCLMFKCLKHSHKKSFLWLCFKPCSRRLFFVLSRKTTWNIFLHSHANKQQPQMATNCNKWAQMTTNHKQATTIYHKLPINDHKPPANDLNPPANNHKWPNRPFWNSIYLTLV